MKDLRKNPRQKCRFPGTADGPRGPVRGACTNLSVGGLFLEGAELHVGSSTTVAVDFGPLGKLNAVARVARHSTSPVGIGVFFERLEQAQLELLKKVIATLEQDPDPAPGPAVTGQTTRPPALPQRPLPSWLSGKPHP